MRYIAFSVMCFFGLIFYSTVYGQIVSPSLSVFQTEVNIDMFPISPGANQEVRVELTSYQINIDTANIVWTINGKVEKSGRGEKVFYFTTGEVGREINVNASITTVDGERINKSVKVNPTEVDLIWEASSYTPPFYKGKPYFSHESGITFIAFPHIVGPNGQEINPDNLTYKWSVNGSVIPEVSGYGRRFYKTVGKLISRPLDVTVEVRDTTETKRAFARINVEPKEPYISIYEKSPIYGIRFERSLKGQEDMGNLTEISVIGIPMFFGVKNLLSPELFYQWSINGLPITDSVGTPVQTLRKKEGVSGISKIGVSIEDESRILNYARASFDLVFKDNASTNKPNENN